MGPKVVKSEEKTMKKKKIVSIATQGVGIALIAGTLIALNVVTLNYKNLISLHFNQKTYRIEKSEEDGDTERYKNDYATEDELNEGSGKVAEEIEAEGMVLLKNKDNSLPLKSGSKVSLFSVSSVDMVLGGTGSGSIDTSKVDDFKTALTNQGFEVNSTLWDFYKSKNDAGYKRSSPNWRGGKFSINEVPWTDVESSCGSSFDNYNDAAIVVLSRSGGEGSDLTAQNFNETTGVQDNTGHYLELSKEEYDMLKAVNGKFNNIVVLINANNPMELKGLDEFSNVKSQLWIGGIGQTGIKAVAKALKGDVVPSGRLVDTYVVDNLSAPAMKNAGANYWIDNKPTDTGWVNEADQYVVEAEGIYVGYRYYETRYEDTVLGVSNNSGFNYADQVIYPFGYGLSYTNFKYSNFKAKEEGDKFTLSVDVTNTGSTYSGKDVVQAYISVPYTDYDKANLVEKSSIQLAGFAKTKVLAPNETENVTISIDKKDLTSYDYMKAKTYILDEGDYHFTIADNAHEAINNVLAKKGKTTADGMTSAGDAGFVYTWHNNSFDDKTYSVDSKTGEKVTNHLDDCSISYYDKYKNFKYLTRQDWNGSFPTVFADSTDEKGEKHITFPQELIDDLAPRFVDKQDEFTMPKTKQDTPFNLASMIGRDYDDPAWEELLDSFSVDEMFKIVRTGGYGTPEMPEIDKPATVEKDGPAGISATLVGGTKGMGYPTEVVLASTFNVDLAKKFGRSIGNDAMFANVQGWYAPAMNIHRTPFSGRNFEYYSEDGFISGQMGSATVEGAREKGLVTYIKHFAFNDTEGVIDENKGIKGSKDGISTFFNEQAAREIYLKSFEISVKEGGSTALMNAFNRAGTQWCGGSVELEHDILVNEWGFTGNIITDMAGLESYMDIRSGLMAGTDLWMNTAENKFVLSDYINNPQIVTYARNATHDVLFSFVNSVAMNGIGANSKIVSVIPGWIQWMIALDVVLGVGELAWLGFLIWYGLKKDKEVKESK